MFPKGSPQYGACADAQKGRSTRARVLPRLQKLDAALAKPGEDRSAVSSSLEDFFDASSAGSGNRAASPVSAAAGAENALETPALRAPEPEKAAESSSLTIPPAPSLPDAPKPNIKRHSKPDYFYRTLLPASWAATALDAYSTAKVLDKGGYEMDPLYTAFGNKNEKGVITSMLVGQAVVTTAAILLHRAGKKHRVLRWIADGLLAGKTGANVEGATHNFLLLSHWPRAHRPRVLPCAGAPCRRF